MKNEREVDRGRGESGVNSVVKIEREREKGERYSNRQKEIERDKKKERDI